MGILVNLKRTNNEHSPEFLKEISDLQIKVREFFKCNEKAYKWFVAKNILLGGVSPLDMIRMGRIEKLKKWINNALEENNRP